MPTDLQLIGRSVDRKDAWAKTDGTAQYVADIPAKDIRHGVLVRSSHHHARIISIDTSAARAIPGVLAVLTTSDIPGKKTFGSLVQDQPVLAIDVVRHIGEPIALVVAESKALAIQAANFVQVQYELLEAVFDPIAALQPGAPLVQPGGNLITSFDITSGDLATGFSNADVIMEEDFSVQRISPAYMEPENSLACWNNDGDLTVWVSSQKPFEDQKAIAEVLGIPTEQIQVMSAVIGGAFGGKEDSSIAILAALAAWSIQGVVKIVNTRHESFTAHPKRHPANIHIKIGAKLDGTLIALHTIVHMDTGAYASYGPAVGGLLTEVAPGPYFIPNVRVQTNVVYTNCPYSGAMRGFGSPQVHFAMESCLNMLADRLGIDSLELRRKNILKPGDRLPTQVVVDDSALSLPIFLDAMKESIRRLQEIPATPGKLSGIGYALAVQSMGLGNRVPDDSSHRLEWLPDGRVIIYLGAPDLGQGLATISEMMVAEELQLPYDHVITAPIDTRMTPDGGATCASRMTYLVGKALLNGSAKLRNNLIDRAAALLKLPSSALVYEHGHVVLPDGKRISAKEFSSRAADDGKTIQAEATATFLYPVETTPQHLPIGMPHVKYLFAAQVVRVEVDPDLGIVTVKDVISIHDPGKVINRAAIEGQVEGGIAMGIGYALYEDVALKSNQQWVDSFTEYLLPTARDIADHLEIQMLEIPEPSGPYGAKGISEICLVPTAPAIANAVYDAVNIRVRELPITPEKLVINRL